MRTLAIWAFVFTTALFSARTPVRAQEARSGSPGVVMVIHGGAGTIRKETMTPEREAAYREALAQALQAGYQILAAGGPALDAVEAAVNVMENSPLFNAGRGAVFTNQGKNELDASIMDGKTRDAGAVASVVGIKNPISAARRVMTESKHVMLVGAGAVAFASEQGLEIADSAYFFTQDRWDRLQKEKKAEQGETGAATIPREKYGTVGAVALDADGNIAAGTSTGGLTNKRWGRVGDSPIIGAGTYADNYSCGVSGTGVGEYFMRGLLAYDVSAEMRYAKRPLSEALARVIHTKLTGMAGADSGGMIALDREGHVAMEFNTAGMYRGYIRADGVPHTFLYKDDEKAEPVAGGE